MCLRPTEGKSPHCIEGSVSHTEKQSMISVMVKGQNPPWVKIEVTVQPQRQEAAKPDSVTELNNEDQCLAINLGNIIIHVSFSHDRTEHRRVKKCTLSNFSSCSVLTLSATI